MEDDENNEDVEQINNTVKENPTKDLDKLNEYVQQMAYKPIAPQPASERTEALSKAPTKYIVGTYTEHKDNLKPKERSDRMRRIVQQHTNIMTIENLEELIRKHRKKQAQYEKDKKQQQINYHETLLKLQKQSENQLMNAIVHKFANTISKRACSTSSSNVETESYQRLQNALVCHMFFDLKVPNAQQSNDFAIYKKLASVLADLILQALFLAHNSDYLNSSGDQDQQLPKPNERDLVIQFRALRAAKKKLYQSRQKSSRGRAVLTHRLNK